jgi:hypothetical protein
MKIAFVLVFLAGFFVLVSRFFPAQIMGMNPLYFYGGLAMVGLFVHHKIKV